MNKLATVLSKLKNPIRKLTLLALAAYLVVQAPQIQRNYLRNKVGSQTYMITNEAGSGGTGFSVVAPSGKVYTMTNAHVCSLAVNNVVYASSANMRKIPLQVVEQSKDTDLCLLTAVNGTPGLTIADSVDLGEEINVVGHPALMPVTLSRGEIIGYKDILVFYSEGPCEKEGGMFITMNTIYGPVCVQKINSLLTSAPAFGGNSGSAVLNYKGQVIGVLFAGDGRINWAILIPLEQVKAFIKAY